jgi:hypothetical protein
VIHFLSIYFILVPLFVGLLLYFRLSLYSKIVLLNIALSCIPQLLTAVYKGVKLPVFSYNLYIIADCLLWFVYFFLLEHNPKKRKLIFSLFVINSLMIVYYFVTTNINTVFIYQLVCINSFIHVLNITNSFYSLSLSKEPIYLTRLPSFWYNAGLFFYASCTFMVFFFYFKINSHFTKGQLNQLWQIHSFFNFLMYLLFTIGIVKYKATHIVK